MISSKQLNCVRVVLPPSDNSAALGLFQRGGELKKPGGIFGGVDSAASASERLAIANKAMFIYEEIKGTTPGCLRLPATSQ